LVEDVMSDEFINFISRKNFCGTKEWAHKYISNYYAKEFGDKREQNLVFVELGVRDGIDLTMFADWLYKSKVIGVDIDPITEYSYRGYGKWDRRESGYGKYDVKFNELNNIDFIQADAYNIDTVNKFDDLSIDYLIDDASHILKDQIKCLKLYYPKMKKGGKVIIEDVGYKYHRTEPGTPDEAISALRNQSKDLYDFKLFDLRNQTNYSYSILIELQKR
tara:strand:+ start:2044 stop:2700 length:657 start_codon:yes stop_codon:yes gene_type:complete